MKSQEFSPLQTKNYKLRTRLKVFVGLSGGVDSSVSAGLLKRAGYDVTGVFIKVWQPDFIEPARTSWGGCTWKEDRLDAMRVCAKLQIPFIELNLEKEYKKEVVDYIFNHYSRDLATLMRLLDKIDHLSLEEKRKITVPFLKNLHYNYLFLVERG